MREVLGFSDVDLGRREGAVSCSLADAQRVVATRGAPRDASGAKIVKRDVLAVLVAINELTAFDAGLHEMLGLPRCFLRK